MNEPRKSLIMTFATNEGMYRNLTVPRPVNGLTVAAVQTAGARIVAANPFDQGNGALTRLDRAVLVEQRTTVLI